MDTPAPPPSHPPVPEMPRARRITCKVCWVLSLLWIVAWPLAIAAFDVQFSGYYQAPRIWATTLYPVAVLWLAYWLVAWFFWVRWTAVGAAFFQPAPRPPSPTEGEPGPSQATELARS